MDFKNIFLIGGSLGALLLSTLSTFKGTIVSAVQAIGDVPDDINTPSGTSKLEFKVDRNSDELSQYGIDIPNHVSGKNLVIEVRYQTMNLSRIAEFAYRIVVNDKLHEFKYTTDSGFMDAEGCLNHVFEINLTTLFIFNIKVECVVTYDNNYTKLLTIKIGAPETRRLDSLSAHDLEDMSSWAHLLSYPVLPFEINKTSTSGNLIKRSYFDSDILLGAQTLLVPSTYKPDLYDVANLDIGFTRDTSLFAQRSGLLVTYLRTLNGWTSYNMAKPPVLARPDSSSFGIVDLSYLSNMDGLSGVTDIYSVERGQDNSRDIIGKTATLLPLCSKNELDHLIDLVRILIVIGVFCKMSIVRKPNWDGLFNIDDLRFKNIDGSFRNADISKLVFLFPANKGLMINRLRSFVETVNTLKGRHARREVTGRTKLAISNKSMVNCDPQWLQIKYLYGSKPLQDETNDLYMNCYFSRSTQQLMIDYTVHPMNSPLHVKFSVITLVCDTRINESLNNIVGVLKPSYVLDENWGLPSTTHWISEMPVIKFFSDKPVGKSYIMKKGGGFADVNDSIPISVRTVLVNRDFVDPTIRDDGKYPLFKSPSWRYTLDTAFGKILFNHIDLGIESSYDGYLMESIHTLGKISNIITGLRVDLFNSHSNLKDVGESIDNLRVNETKLITPFDEVSGSGNVLLFKYSSIENMISEVKENLNGCV